MVKLEIINAIQAYETIIIHRHVRPDPDAYGSQVGLKNIIQTSFPNKRVFAVGAEDPSLHFLARMDQINDDVYKGALVIVCDTANTERISDERYHLGDKLIKIDHHPNVDPYGDIRWIDTEASSTSEMIYQLYEEGKTVGMQMTNEAARLIYSGIVGDTGRFLFPSTTNLTFEIAGELVKYPFDRTELYEQLYETNENLVRLQGYILQNYKMTKSGMSSIKITQSLLHSYDVEPLETGQLVGVLGNIKGIKAWVFFVEEEKNKIRVRLRSKGPVINDLAAKYDGGGHPLAAGAQVSNWEEADELISELEKICKAYES